MYPATHDFRVAAIYLRLAMLERQWNGAEDDEMTEALGAGGIVAALYCARRRELARQLRSAALAANDAAAIKFCEILW